MNKIRIEYICYILFAFFYALILSYIPEVLLRDRDNYIIYAIDPVGIFESNLTSSLKAFLTGEPLFLLINYLLGLVIDPYMIPSLISFFISFMLVFFMLKETENKLWEKIFVILFITFIPFCFHLQLVVLRQGLALSIFLIVLMNTSNKRYWFISAFILGFIHSSFFILSFLLFIIYLVRNMKYSSKLIIYIIVSLIIALSIITVGGLLGARQTELYESESSGGSGLSFLLYLSMLILILSRGAPFLQGYVYEPIAIFGLILYLILYFTSPIAGRLLVTFIPFIICLLLRTRSKISYIFIFIYLLLNLVTFKSTVINNSFTPEFSTFGQIFNL